MVRPLVKLTPDNGSDYKQLLFDHRDIYAIHEDHSFEDILSHVIHEMGGSREDRKQEVIDILNIMDLSDIP
jgi:hypothetical protein